MAIKHGMSNSPEYRAWINMIERCEYNSESYVRNYSSRGISLCSEWRESFLAFFNHIGPRPSKKHSVDRIDVNSGYRPGNVRWATQKEQMRNTTFNRIVDFDGRKMTLAEAVTHASVPYNTVLYRLKRGWTTDQAIRLPRRRGLRP